MTPLQKDPKQLRTIKKEWSIKVIQRTFARRTFRPENFFSHFSTGQRVNELCATKSGAGAAPTNPGSTGQRALRHQIRSRGSTN